jgi:quinol monooxygenase YgiN
MAEEFIIAGWLDYGSNRDAVLGHFAEVARQSREEPGCLDYVVCADPDEVGRIVVLERWISEQDLVDHFKTPHIADFREAIAPYSRSGRSLRRYFISRSEEFQSSRSVADPAV